MASIHSETEQIDYGKDAAIHFPAAVKDSANESSDHMTTVDTLDAMKEETCDQLEYVSSGIIHDESEKSNEAKPRKKRKEPDDDDESIQKKLKAPTFRIRRVGKTPKLEHEDTEHTETTVNQTGFKSKHDLKWDLMFDKLVEYKRKFNNAMVPQCYDQEPRLGRWVHYQRGKKMIYLEETVIS